jgi:CubicO group peptidase (beta-lactamase class C family)
MLLGYIVERAAGHTLDVFLRDTLYEPLGLLSTTFNPLENNVDPFRIAATSHGNPFERRMVYDDTFGYRVDVNPQAWDGWREYTLRGEVNDGNAFYANDGVAGHAGLFSTVGDLQTLLDLLLHDGSLSGEIWIRSEVVREFLRKDTLGDNGLGWALDPEVIQARSAPPGTFGHTGFTGTSVVAIPEYALSIILLTNRQNVGPDETGDYYDLNPTRQRLVALVLEEAAPLRR